MKYEMPPITIAAPTAIAIAEPVPKLPPLEAAEPVVGTTGVVTGGAVERGAVTAPWGTPTENGLVPDG